MQPSARLPQEEWSHDGGREEGPPPCPVCSGRLVPLRDEQGVEAFYNVGVTPWFHVTPDFQVVIPTRERADTALVFGLRAKVDF